MRRQKSSDVVDAAAGISAQWNVRDGVAEVAA
jgi:hypothetical protein